MVRDFEQSKSPGGNDTLLSKLRQRLKEKETALEVGARSDQSPWRLHSLILFDTFSVFPLPQLALDAKFAAIEEKDNEIHQLQLSLREKERDLDRLSNLLSHNEETISVSSFCLTRFLHADEIRCRRRTLSFR